MTPTEDDAGSRKRADETVLVLGDAHADDADNREALLAAYRETESDAALQVGDVLYYDLPAPTWFVAGNNEDFDIVESLRRGDRTLTDVNRPRLLASDVAEVRGLRVAGLSGNFAPTQFDRTREELSGDRRRHFVREDVEAAKALTDIDVFLCHEAPHGLLTRGGYDPGCEHVDDILSAVEPDLCLVGHFHEHVEGEFGETRVVVLAPVWDGYYTLDPETLTLSRHPRPDGSASAN